MINIIRRWLGLPPAHKHNHSLVAFRCGSGLTMVLYKCECGHYLGGILWPSGLEPRDTEWCKMRMGIPPYTTEKRTDTK